MITSSECHLPTSGALSSPPTPLLVHWASSSSFWDHVEPSRPAQEAPSLVLQDYQWPSYGHGCREVIEGQWGTQREQQTEPTRHCLPDPSFSLWRIPCTRGEREREKEKGRWLCECRHLILTCRPSPVLSTSLKKMELMYFVNFLHFDNCTGRYVRECPRS